MDIRYIMTTLTAARSFCVGEGRGEGYIAWIYDTS